MLERALHGIEIPVWHRGVQVGTRRHFDERLTCFLLSARNGAGAQKLERYTAASEFWSERWDRLLDRVGDGPLVWTPEPPEPPEMDDPDLAAAAAQAMADTDRSDAAALERRTPDHHPLDRHT